MPHHLQAIKVSREGTAVLHAGLTTLVLHLNVGSQALTTSNVQVQADMTHPGMVPVKGQVESLGAGRYRIGNLNLSMAGDWVLSVTTVSQPGHSLTGTFPLSVLP